MLTFISDACLENYVPHKEQSIDEAMIAFRGQLSFRQYISAKPTKYGIKVWVRADSHNGYVHEFKVYVAKPHGVAREVGLGKKVVLELSEKVRGKNNRVFRQLLQQCRITRTTVRNGTFWLWNCEVNFKIFAPPQMSNKNQREANPPSLS